MTMTDWIIAGYAVLFCLLWVAGYCKACLVHWSVTCFEDLDPPSPDVWPSLSIVIAARNEAEQIRSTVERLLAQDYKNLQLIVVNDRSTDGTGDILRELEADERLTIVHISELPDGWLGKVHALHNGVQQAEGDWLLFTDGDVQYEPGALKRAVAYVLDEKADHLAMLPQLSSGSFLLRTCVRAFLTMFMDGMNVHRVALPQSRTYIGSGGFNLVRRAAFERTPGFEWLRLEIVDDVGVGLMLKEAGFSTRFAYCRSDLHVRWYNSVRAMFVGLEKNAFGGMAQYQLWRLTVYSVIGWLYLAAPIVALTCVHIPYLWIAGAVAISMLLPFAISHRWRTGEAILPSFFLPVGIGMIGLMGMQSAIKATRRGAVNWRGTRYPLDQLRRHQRVQINPFRR